MDILAHTLWTTALTRKGNIEIEKKKKRSKINMLWIAFFGIFPDLFAFTIPFFVSFYMVASGQQYFESFATRHQVADGFNLAHDLYKYSHSIIIWLLVFLVVWLIFKKPWLPLLGWLLHILIDIPSHAINFFPTPFLFPISTYVFPYGVAWSNMYFMIVNYSALFILWFAILIKKYKGVFVKKNERNSK